MKEKNDLQLKKINKFELDLNDKKIPALMVSKRVENIILWILKNHALIEGNIYVKVILNIKLSEVKGEVTTYPDSKI